jgi:thioredoxin-related protein
MFKKLTQIALISLFTVTILSAQESKPQLADNILTAALKESKSTNKNVFLIFHASWCGWCKRLDKAMQSDELKKIFEDNYIITI